MKNKSIWKIRNYIIIIMALSVLVTGILFFQSKQAFFIVAPFVLLLLAAGVVILVQFRREIRTLMLLLSKEFGTSRSKVLYEFPMPVMVCDVDGRILWYNNQFQTFLAKQDEMIGWEFNRISERPMEEFLSPSGVQVDFRGKSYCVYGTSVEEHDLYTFYFSDITTLTAIAEEYELSHPSVMLVMLDNYDEVFEGKKESAKSTILGVIDESLEAFFGETNGFFRRLSHDRFLAVVEQRHLEQMIESRFHILDTVREKTKEKGITVTLSIGVGAGGTTLYESESFASQALDMALGRGGDQAAVKTVNGFDFYGGVSQGIEKRTKVKTRVIATALREFIDQSERVLVMGHRFGDLDSMGGSIAMAKIARQLGKKSYIIVDYKKNLATALIDKMTANGEEGMFVHPSDAGDLITPNTLLIVVDTHSPDVVEAPGVYERCKNVVVIDHHRKMVNYIDNAVIFYHEPYASSASEMITELAQYMNGVVLQAPEAEGLLAGIMLDTKNFVLRAGVRTFEAAAYLKGRGADTVSVRKLFSNTIDSYQQKTRIVSNAETYRNCAIAMGDFQCDDMRVVAPQAADELLGISDVDASFVLYQTGTTTNISGRSLGAVNVQVIMEKLGGGGHQTMAACQLENTNLEQGRQHLLDAIDQYLNSRTDKKS